MKCDFEPVTKRVSYTAVAAAIGAVLITRNQVAANRSYKFTDGANVSLVKVF